MKPDLSLPISIFTRCAVYAWRRGNFYLYIGQSRKTIQRIIDHHVIDKKELLQKNDVIEVFFCCESELDKFEREMIQRYNPPYNTIKWDPSSRTKRFETFKDAALAKGKAASKGPTEIDPRKPRAGKNPDAGTITPEELEKLEMNLRKDFRPR